MYSLCCWLLRWSHQSSRLWGSWDLILATRNLQTEPGKIHDEHNTWMGRSTEPYLEYAITKVPTGKARRWRNVQFCQTSWEWDMESETQVPCFCGGRYDGRRRVTESECRVHRSTRDDCSVYPGNIKRLNLTNMEGQEIHFGTAITHWRKGTNLSITTEPPELLFLVT